MSSMSASFSHSERLSQLSQLEREIEAEKREQLQFQRDNEARRADDEKRRVQATKMDRLEAQHAQELSAMREQQDALAAELARLKLQAQEQGAAAAAHLQAEQAARANAEAAVARDAQLKRELDAQIAAARAAQQAAERAAAAAAATAAAAAAVPQKCPPLVGGGWQFHEGMDAYGNDLNGGPDYPAAQDQLVHIRHIAAKADGQYPRAVAFNTIGCIKSSVANMKAVPRGGRSWISDPRTVLPGLFVRDAAVPKGFLYLPGYDSFGNDTRKVDVCCLPTLQHSALADNAIAFNTLGWIKRALVANDRIQKTPLGDLNGVDGLFVRYA